jgi:hypothetical protein
MEHYNANASMLPNAGGSIEPMRGGGAPVGYNPDVSILPATSNSIPIVDMKGGDETLPMAAAATVTVTADPFTPAKAVVDPLTKMTVDASGAIPGKTIRFILFDTEFKDFSTEENESSQKILALLGTITGNKKDALQQIYDGIENLRTIDLDKFLYLKRLLLRMGLDYAKEKGELKEDPLDPEQTDIKLAFSADKVTVTLTIPCDQLPSCRQTNLPMAAAATVMVQTGGDDTRIISLFGEEYTFSKRPTVSDINDYKELLTQLEVDKEASDFKATLLGEIYDGCYTDGPIISRRDCSTFGTLLEKLGQTYAETMYEMMGRRPLFKKAGESSVKKEVLDNGDIQLTFTFSNFGKQAVESENENVDASPDQVSTHGMINRKNACFCISVLQLLFSIPEIRTIMKEYKCEDKVFAEVSTLIKTENYAIPAVNQDGVLCALFKLFEELGKNMALFSTSKAGALSKGDVPYELLGYIMKNFERDSIVNGRAYTVGREEDAEIFLTFLFGIFGAKGIAIRPLFQFTQETTIDEVENVLNQPSASQSKEDKMSQPIVWIIPDRESHAFKTSYDGVREQNLIRLSSGTKESFNVPYRVTLTLEKNPYLLVRPFNSNGDLSGIPLILSIQKGIDMKKLMLYGMIRRSGAAGSGHYIYDRQDLTSKKHILYNDTAVTLFDDEIQMNAAGGLNAYLLVYMEVESALASAPAEAPASASANSSAGDTTSASASTPVKTSAIASVKASASAPASAPAMAPAKASAKVIASASAMAPKKSVTVSAKPQAAQSLEQLAQQAQQQAQQRQLELKQLRQRQAQQQAKQQAKQQKIKNNKVQRQLETLPKSTQQLLSEAPPAPTHKVVIGKGGSITDTNDDTPHRRTLRASKQSPKKRTLRAAKKLRQLLNST